jgi:hypothetical protein
LLNGQNKTPLPDGISQRIIWLSELGNKYMKEKQADVPRIPYFEVSMNWDWLLYQVTPTTDQLEQAHFLALYPNINIPNTALLPRRTLQGHSERKYGSGCAEFLPSDPEQPARWLLSSVFSCQIKLKS